MEYIKIKSGAIVFLQTFAINENLSSRKEIVAKGIGHVIRDVEFYYLGEHIWYSESISSRQNVESCYEIEGFDFNVSRSAIDFVNPQQSIQGHCRVFLSFFFNKTISIAYHILLNGDDESCYSFDFITLLSKWFLDSNVPSYFSLGHTAFRISDFPISKAGEWLPDGNRIEITDKTKEIEKQTPLLKELSLRYKKYIVQQCFDCQKVTSGFLEQYFAQSDINHVFIDLWEGMKVSDSPGPDSLLQTIKTNHKNELLHLFTLNCGWQNMDEDTFSDICGKDMTMENNELLLSNDVVTLLIETEHDIIRRYNLSVPEYLKILQLQLARKATIIYATKTLLDTVVHHSKDIEQMVFRNQDLNFRLARQLLAYDALQYFDPIKMKLSANISSALEIEKYKEQFEHNMAFIDSTVRNIKDGASSSREIVMNIILGIVSVISAFQLFFVGTRMPFLSDFWHVESGTIGAIVITIIAALAIFFVLLLVITGVRTLYLSITHKD